MNAKRLAVLVAVALSGCMDVGESLEPQVLASQQTAPERYIVLFRDTVDVDAAVAGIAREGAGMAVHYVYRHAVRGFAATMPVQAAAALRQNPRVRLVELDGIATVDVDSVQSDPPSWGLDRIDQRTLPLDSAYHYRQTGIGAVVYVIDTGIRGDHPEFGGRVRDGYDFIDNDPVADDCHGHGTHVAGTVGGATTGVAKGVQIVAVKVLGCSGSGAWSGVIAGIDFVAQDAATWGRPAVANMSIGGPLTQSVTDAVEGSVRAGVVHVVAAGNSSSDACQQSPAAAPSAITVGSTDADDRQSSFSNIGPCVDIWYPGRSILSAYYDGTYKILSGTSMATPHQTGVAALYRSAYPSATPAEVTSALKAIATPGVVLGLPAGTVNLFGFSLFDGEEPAPPPPPPPPARVHVGDLDADVTVRPSNWVVRVTITVHDQFEQPVAGVLVRGSWSYSGTSDLCTTGTDGTCEIRHKPMRASVPSTTMTVRLEGPPPYDGALNHDPDGDSDGTRIVAAR